MQLTKDLAKCGNTMTKFKSWFTSTYPNILFKEYITSQFELQLGILLLWLESNNILLAVNGKGYGLYYIDYPTNAIVNFIYKGKCHVICEHIDCDNLLDGYYKGFVHIVKLMENPF